MPSAATLAAFFCAEARPFFLRTTTASSMSPFASTSAFLQSIIPAPVFSRSSFTVDALISIDLPFEQKNSHKRHKMSFCASCGSFLLHHRGFVRRFYWIFFAFDAFRPSTLERRNDIAHSLFDFF